MSSASSPDTPITLHVGLASDYPDWEESSNPNYTYQFEGGDYDQNRGFKFAHGTDSSVKWVSINLNGYGTNPVSPSVTAAKYNITSVTATQDFPVPAVADQLTVMPASGVNGGDKFQTIKDLNQLAASGEITVVVTDISVTPNVAGISCDPRWDNS